MDTNPILKAYRNIPSMNMNEPEKKNSKGLLSRSDNTSNKNKMNNKNDLTERVARYVNDIRNYNVKDNNA
tara:strand:- start:737 stop:946 length:210 start_codon:yes stop_codon:yes gene_type:complete